MRRLWWLLGALTTASLLGLGVAAVPASAGPLISCASGYIVITNHNVAGGITANGIGNDLTQSNPAGSCWKAIWGYTDPLGGTGYQYENEGGYCMWNSGDFPEIARCVQGDHLEQYYGDEYVSGNGWVVAAQDPASSFWTVYGCVVNSAVILQSGGTLHCPYWNFG